MRARVEHIFIAMRKQLGVLRIRSIGRVRVTFVIGMRSLLYNVCRYDTLRVEPRTS